MTDCLQIKRREEGEALGATKVSAADTFKWNDAFWEDVYNQAASATRDAGTSKRRLVDSAAEDSDAESSSSASNDSSDESSFDGELTILRRTEPLLVRRKPEKSSNSKAIKKEKKTKKEKKDKKKKKDKKEKKKDKN